MSECEDVGNLRSEVSPWKDPGALCESFSPLSKLFLKVWRACVMFPSKWLHACICRVKGNLNAWRNPSAHRVMCNESKGNKSKLRDSLTRWTRCTFVDGALKLCVRICCFEDCSLRRCTSLQSDHQSKRKLFPLSIWAAFVSCWWCYLRFSLSTSLRSEAGLWVWVHSLL